MNVTKGVVLMSKFECEAIKEIKRLKKENEAMKKILMAHMLVTNDALILKQLLKMVSEIE